MIAAVQVRKGINTSGPSPAIASGICPLGHKLNMTQLNISKAKRINPEINYFIVTSKRDPRVPWHVTQNWGVGRCEPGGAYLDDIHVPRDLVVPDATSTRTPNKAAAFLHPDGHTLIQMNPLARCQAGGSVFGYPPQARLTATKIYTAKESQVDRAALGYRALAARFD